ncbi:MAG: hypothetical protein HGA76_05765 [Candidatus Firestonebacteria bacterium]|nr:hypothetical protein [Candidatus Firestonebacteria bacterium]
MKKIFSFLVFAGLLFQGVNAAADITLGDFSQRIRFINSYKKNAAVQFSLDKAQIQNQSVLKIEYQNKNQGYCGVFEPIKRNWNEATSIDIFTKGTPGKILQITLVDAGNRYFIHTHLYQDKEWHMLELAIDDFVLNPYFQPEGVKDRTTPINLTNVRQIEFSPTQQGEGVFYIGQIIVKGVSEKRKGLQKSAEVSGAHIYFNRKIDNSNLEKYYPYCTPIELFGENQVTAGIWQDYKMLNATVYLFADIQNLYVAASVRESDPNYNDKTQGNIWNGDCIELFLGFGNELKRSYGPKDFQIGLSPGKGNLAPSIWVYNQNRKIDMPVFVEKNDKGYQIKTQIPIKELGLDPFHEGQLVFVDVAVDKAGPDGNRILQLTWHGKGLSHIDPTQWNYGVISANRFDAMEGINKVLNNQWLKNQNAEVSINGGQVVSKISPSVYGINAFPAVDTPDGWMDYSKNAVALYKKAHLSLLRFPGGDWGDEHKLLPAQIQKFVALCRELKAEPMIQVKLHEGTADEAADLVEFCKKRGLNVKYWAIGNEPDFFESRHFVNHPFRVADYVKQFQSFSRAMKKVDPQIVICGPELAQYGYSGDKPDMPFDKNGQSWMETFLKECGKDVDLVTFHHYPFGGVNGVPDWHVETLLDTTETWDTLIPGLARKIKKITNRNIPIGITEINSDWSGLFNGEATPDTFANAVWWTMTLGEMMKQQVNTVCFFALYDTGSYGIVTKELGTLPAFYTYRLFEQFGDELINVQNNNNDLKVYASRTKKGYNVIFVNKHTKMDITATLRFKSMACSTIKIRRYSEYEFLNNQDFSYNELKPADKIEYTFPSYSITQFNME